MPREFSRVSRVGQQLQKELAMILQKEIRDERLSMVTVNKVEVSNDMSYAKVFVSFLDEKTWKTQLAVLHELTTYIRKLLASQIKMRVVPEIKFLYDDSFLQGLFMNEVVTKAVSDDALKRQNIGSNEESLDDEEK